MIGVRWAWGGIVAALGLFLLFRFTHGPVVDTGLLSLMPSTEFHSVLSDTNDLMSKRGSRLMAFSVTDPDPETATVLGDRLVSELTKTGWVHLFLTEFSLEQRLAVKSLYFPLRYQLLSQKDREIFVHPHALAQLVQRTRAGLFNPASGFFSDLIPQDPFLLFIEYFKEPLRMASRSAGGDDSVFVALEWKFDPFNSKNQDLFHTWLDRFRETIKNDYPHSRVFSTGVMSFARAQRTQAERELFWISVGSLIGVLGLLGWVFRKPSVVALAVLPVAVGVLAGVGATLALFDRIHIITLTFGTTLLGCGVDYPIHFLSYRRQSPREERGVDSLRILTPGLLLGMGTSVIGYMALGASPLPGLRQVAVFSSVGLLAALTTVYAWLPQLSVPRTFAPSPHPLVRGAERCWVFMDRLLKGHTKFRILLLLLFFFIAGKGLFQVRFNDDVRFLQKAPDSVLVEDAQVRGAGPVEGNRFILIEGSTEEIVLRRQELLFDQLTVLFQEGSLSSVQSLAPLLPSQERQESNAHLVRNLFLSQPNELQRTLQDVGLPASVANELLKDVAVIASPVTPDTWLASPASAGFRNLWIGKTINGFASVTLVSGVRQRSGLEQALTGVPGVRYFDQVEEYSELLKRYRIKSTTLVFLAFLVACGLLMVRFGFQGGVWANRPPLIGVLFAFSFFGWSGQPVHLFHTLGAFLVLAMGMDYGIFFAECRRFPSLLTSARLSVSLSAATTLVSFGLLALCSNPAVSAIGQTAFIGLFIAFLISPFPTKGEITL
jgi:predicted exporter